MSETTQLYLHEELMLLALRDEKGTLQADDTAFVYTVAAAMLAELLLSRHLIVDEGAKKKNIIDIRNSKSTGDPLLDECLTKVRDAKRRASLSTWVSRFAGIKKLKHRIALQLCQRGILRADEDKILLIFTRKIYPELDPQPETELVKRLQTAIFTDEAGLDARTVVLVALADKAGVLKNAFAKQDLKRRKDRLKQIAEGELIAKAAQDVIDGVRAAMMVAVLVPSIVAVTTSH